MAFEDLFGNANVDPEGFAGPQNSFDASFNAGGVGAQFEDLFSDPNFIRGLGEAGASISSGEPIGKSLGEFGSNLVRRRAVQEGARESRGRNEQLMEFLFKNKFLGEMEDNETNDFIKISADGTISSGMKNTPQTQSFANQQPLESIRRPSAGGDDLPDFSNQPGREAFDFAGLDSDDIGMLLRAEQQFGELDQNQMKMILREKERRTTIAESNKRRAEDLRQLGEDRLARVEAKRLETEEKKTIAETLAESKLVLAERKSALKVNADKLTPNELATEKLELRKLTKEVENLESAEEDVTPSQQATIDKNNADLERKETELGMKLDELEKEEIFSIQPSFVNNKGKEIEVEFEEREANAVQANNRLNNKVFYHVQQPVVTDFFDGKSDQDGNVVPIFLPKHPTTGKQITSSDVIDTARANKISPEEVLRQWGLIK